MFTKTVPATIKDQRKRLSLLLTTSMYSYFCYFALNVNDLIKKNMEMPCKTAFKNFFKRKSKSKQSAQHALKELGIYLIFLLVATVVTLSSREIGMFYFNNTISRLFLNEFASRAHGFELAYEDLVTISDWWSFTETAFVESIALFESETTHGNGSTDGNILLGVPRLRQIRVKNESCKVKRILNNEFETCHGKYEESREDISGFLGTPFSTQSEAGTYGISGLISKYRGGGYIEVLTLDRDENEGILSQLKDAGWTDAATRLVLVEFALFNSNVNLFCNAKLLAEVPPTGGVITSSHLQALKYYPLWNDGGYFVMLSSIVFFALILYFTMNLVVDILSVGCLTVLRSMFKVLNIVVLLIAYLAMVYMIWHTIYLKSILKTHEENPKQFFSLDIICFWNGLFIDMMGICIFISWIQIFKYIKFNKTMMQFSTTLQRCAVDLLGFSIMFAIVFIAFAYLSVLLFGSVDSDFRDFSTAVLTLMRTVLGDFDYEKLEAANRVLGPIFFLSFILFVFFVLMNMFLAIINETYSDVKSEEKEGKDDEFSEYLKTLVGKIKRHVFNRTKVEEKSESQSEEPSTSRPARKSSYSVEKKEPKDLADILDKYFEVVSIDRNGEEDSLNERVNSLEDKLENLVARLDEILNKQKVMNSAVSKNV